MGEKKMQGRKEDAG
jgi:hypothetical protein